MDSYAGKTLWPESHGDCAQKEESTVPEEGGRTRLGAERSAATVPTERAMNRSEGGFKPRVKIGSPPDHLGWTRDFMPDDATIQSFQSPEWLFPNLVIQGHLIVVSAEPGGGKTTIFAWVAGQLVAAGKRVFYVNADIASTDIHWFHAQAKRDGWVAILPDFVPGKSVREVLEHLESLAKSRADLSGTVFIFDTLKKLVQLLQKDRVKDLLSLMRALTAKGMTIILLGHTNKYKDGDGNPVFEGTGDVRADVDELIYFIPKDNGDRSLIVSTHPDKVRGAFEPITFTISKDREVSLSRDYIDVKRASSELARYKDDRAQIDIIHAAIQSGANRQVDIVTYCGDRGMSRRKCLRLLENYASGSFKQWESRRALERNTLRYYALEARIASPGATESDIGGNCS